ncbi:hypothetical protein DL93DRAFT_2145607 [Clavulina sp. PMI_390]|nr:hypothetical protein DL93DRAFT_2145607 [Clavulina sp. PMI_390]
MVLTSTFEHTELPALQMILGTIATVHECLSTTSIKSLASWIIPLATPTTQDEVEKIISLLSFLVAGERDIYTTAAKVPISFMNYLRYANIVKAYVPSDPSFHQVFASYCLKIMQNKQNGLHFNMCKLGTSYKLNSEVGDLPALIDGHIGDALSYACRFWAFHAAQAHTIGATLLGSIETLLSTSQFLHWLEVMSITRSDPHTSLMQLKAQSHLVCDIGCFGHLSKS